MADLKITITGDSGAAEAALKKVETSLNGVSNNAQKTNDTLNKLKNLAISYLSIDFLKGSIMGFAEADRGAKLFENTMNRIGGNVQGNVESFGKFASAMQEVTAYEDDAIISAGNMMAQLTNLSGQGLELATRKTMDFASAMGVDLQSASTMVARAISGSTDSLGRLKVQGLEGVTDAAERASIVIQYLGKDFNNIAMKEGESAYGKIKQMSNAFGGLRDTIGESLAPVVMFLIDGLRNMISAFQSLPDPVKIGAIAVTALAIAFRALMVSTGPIGLILTGVTIAATALFAIFGKGKKENADLENSNKILKNSFDSVKGSIEETTAAHKKLQDSMMEQINKNISTQTEYYKFIGDKRNEELANLELQKIKLLENDQLTKDQRLEILSAYKLKVDELNTEISESTNNIFQEEVDGVTNKYKNMVTNLTPYFDAIISATSDMADTSAASWNAMIDNMWYNMVQLFVQEIQAIAVKETILAAIALASGNFVGAGLHGLGALAATTGAATLQGLATTLHTQELAKSSHGGKAPMGADFYTSGKQTITVGDNASGRERVIVRPESNSYGDKIGMVIQNMIVRTDNPDDWMKQLEQRTGLTLLRR